MSIVFVRGLNRFHVLTRLIVVLLSSGFLSGQVRVSEIPDLSVDLNSAYPTPEEYARSLVTSFVTTKRQTTGLCLSDQEIQRRAILTLARTRSESEKLLSSKLARFLKGVRGDVQASKLNLALADFLEGKYSEAATSARQSYESLKQDRVKADPTQRMRIRRDAEITAQILIAAGDTTVGLKALELTLKSLPEKFAKMDAASILIAMGQAHEFQIGRSKGSAISESRTTALSSYRRALAAIKKEEHPTLWADIQESLGRALRLESEGHFAKRSADLLAESKDRFFHAAEAFQGCGMALAAARCKNRQCLILESQAISAAWKDRGEILLDAKTQLQNQLKIFTRKTHPFEWSWTQYLLARVELRSAFGTGFEERKACIERALACVRLSIQVPKKSHSMAMARCDLFLGQMHRQQAQWGLAPEKTKERLQVSIGQIEKAIDSYEALGELYLQANAELQASISLGRLADFLPTAESAPLLKRRNHLLRQSQSLNQRSIWPREWASIEEEFAEDLRREARIASSEIQKGILDQAIQKLESALEVFTRKYEPVAWGRIKTVLCGTQLMNTHNLDGKLTMAAHCLAVEKSILDVLKVVSRTHVPEFWAWTTSQLAWCYMSQASFEIGRRKSATIEKAIQCYRSVLAIHTEERASQTWAYYASKLSFLFRWQASESSGKQQMVAIEESISLLRKIESIYQTDGPSDSHAWSLLDLGDGLSLYTELVEGPKKIAALEECVTVLGKAQKLTSFKSDPSGYREINGKLLLAQFELAESETKDNKKRLLYFEQTLRTMQDPNLIQDSGSSFVGPPYMHGRVRAEIDRLK